MARHNLVCLEREHLLRIHLPDCFHLFNQKAEHEYPRHPVEGAAAARRVAEHLGKPLVACRHCAPDAS